jgi:hypothetical protein
MPTLTEILNKLELRPPLPALPKTQESIKKKIKGGSYDDQALPSSGSVRGPLRFTLEQLIAACPDTLTQAPSTAEVSRFIKLVYRFIEPMLSPGSPPRTLPGGALSLLADFLKKDQCNAFSHLRLQTLVYQLTLRVLAPRRVDQQNVGFCGPAALLVALWRQDPIGCARCAISLATQGSGSIGNLKFQPHAAIRQFNPAGHISEADWLLLGSLRNQTSFSLLAGGQVMPQGKLARYGGTSLKHFFDWCVQAGWQRVLLVEPYPDLPEYRDKRDLVSYGTSWLRQSVMKKVTVDQVVRFHPPKTEEASREWYDDAFDKEKLVLRLQDKLESGWTVFLLMNAKLAEAAREFTQDLHRDHSYSAQLLQDRKALRQALAQHHLDDLPFAQSTQYDLSSTVTGRLDALIVAYKKLRNPNVLTVYGHAVRSELNPQAAAEGRARAVADYLTQHGISERYVRVADQEESPDLYADRCYVSVTLKRDQSDQNSLQHAIATSDNSTRARQNEPHWVILSDIQLLRTKSPNSDQYVVTHVAFSLISWSGTHMAFRVPLQDFCFHLLGVVAATRFQMKSAPVPVLRMLQAETPPKRAREWP